MMCNLGTDGKERYGLIVGNLYGLPSSGRVYAKERNRLVLEELPKRTGWKTRKLTSEPCMYEIITGKVTIVDNERRSSRFARKII